MFHDAWDDETYCINNGWVIAWFGFNNPIVVAAEKKLALFLGLTKLRKTYPDAGPQLTSG